MSFIRRLGVRQRPRAQRWRYFPPIAQEPKTEALDNSASHSHAYNVDHGGNGLGSPWIDVASELAANNITPAVHADERPLIASTSRDTAGGVEKPDLRYAQKERERLAFKSDSSLACMTNIEEGDRIRPRRVRDKMQHAKNQTIRSISAAIPRLRRGYPSGNEPAMTASITQLAFSSSVHDERHHSQTMRREEKDTVAVLPDAKGEQRKSEQSKHAEPIAGESEEIEKLRRDLSESYSRITELQKRCEAQSRDLENSNSFLNAADKSSDSDVIQALQRLNAEVQQNTTYMADYLTEAFEFEGPTTNPTEEQVSVVQRASARIGHVLVKSLRTNTPDDVPMLLQIAFQAYLTSVLCQAISSWVIEPGYNRFIREMYQRLRRVEAQAISGRWRSLARIHNIHSWITHPESLVKGILADISDIVLAAGCTAPQSDVITKVTSKFDEKISLLVDLAGRLSKMFDGVISCDFEVFVAMPGQVFRNKMMEDADGQARVEEASVLCATHIGLIKRAPVGTLWEKGEKQKIVVVKTKVLFESFLNAELED